MTSKKMSKSYPDLHPNILDSVGSGVYWLNQMGEYLGCNSCFSTIAGLPQSEDIKGKTHAALPWKDQVEFILKNENLVLLNNTPLTTTEEWQISNGEFHRFLIKRNPLYDEKNKLIGLVGTLIDITSQNENKIKTKEPALSIQKKLAFYTALAKESMQQSTKDISTDAFVSFILDYFDKIIACMPGNVYWLNKNSIFLGCNDNVAKMLGLKSRDDIIGMTHAETAQLTHWSAGQAESFAKDDEEVVTTGIPKINIEEPPISDSHGKEIYYLTSRVPLRDSHNSIIGVVGISVDITDLKKAKQRAEIGEQTKTEFIANMSHDIRTPLSGVVGLAGILENSLIDAYQKQLAHDLSQSGNELLNMLNEILDVISVDNVNTHDIHEEPFDMHQLIRGIVDLERSSIALKKIKLISHIDEEIPSTLLGDQKKIHHILLNLVGNSIKFTTTGCVEIKITLLEKQKNSVQLQFQIIDTGKGIPPEALDKIFDAFYRVSPSYKGLDKGHGLGLHIAQSYTQLLGGKISVASKLDEGSKFSFSLALKIADKDAAPQNVPHESSKLHPKASPSSPPSTSADSTKSSDEPLPDNAPQILVIEDNHVARTIAKTLLRNAKCSVTTASDGESGLEIAKNRRFDLIISDVGLPGISGLEVARQLRDYEKKRSKPAVPLIGLTAHVGGSTHNDCINSGMNEVIIKPMNAEAIETLCAKFFLGEETKLPAVDSGRPPEFAETPKPQKSSGLGEDLPDTETELFALEPLLIFDVDKARKILGNNHTLLMDLIKTTITSLIPEELLLMEQAHDTGNWKTVSRIAHKLKGGFLSIGLTRAATACQYLERYYKAGHTVLLEKLYAQVLETLDTTSVSLKSFIR